MRERLTPPAPLVHLPIPQLLIGFQTEEKERDSEETFSSRDIFGSNLLFSSVLHRKEVKLAESVEEARFIFLSDLLIVLFGRRIYSWVEIIKCI